MVSRTREYIRRAWDWTITQLTTPEDDDDDWDTLPTLKTQPAQSESESPEIFTYQLTYENEAGARITSLIEATHTNTDEDHVELWFNDVLLLMMERSSVLVLRNVSLLDMKADL